MQAVNNGWLWVGLIVAGTIALAIWNRKKILEEEKLEQAQEAEKQQRAACRAARRAKTAAVQNAMEETDIQSGLQDA